MCTKLPYLNPRIDSCLRWPVQVLQSLGYKTIASCCGHGRYPRTILYRDSQNVVRDFDSKHIIGVFNPRIKRRGQRWYVLDSVGYYRLKTPLTHNPLI